MKLQPYLIFPGTCRDALEFYAAALGGSIEHLQTVGESPLPSAPEHEARVFNSVFVADGVRFMASDGEPGKDPSMGQNFAMFVSCRSHDEQRGVLEALSLGGRVLFPVEQGLGMVIDRFGLQWMIVVGE